MLFHPRVLYGLLAVSVLTNVVLIGRTASIDWHSLVHLDQAVPDAGSEDHIRGAIDAPVTIIEYSDFECPFCARFHEVVKTVVASDASVRWIYRHLPLSILHPLAVAAAEASECASEQDRFWEYADLVFERQAALDEVLLETIARDLKLDEASFRACRQSGRQRDRVASDVSNFQEGHLSGTPTWFINGRRFEGTVSIDELRGAIAAAR